jgi:hypothetical protein
MIVDIDRPMTKSYVMNKMQSEGSVRGQNLIKAAYVFANESN